MTISLRRLRGCSASTTSWSTSAPRLDPARDPTHALADATDLRSDEVPAVEPGPLHSTSGSAVAKAVARQRRLERTQAAIAAAGYGRVEPKKLNELNPYSFDADGWCEPTEARVEAYDRPGPPVDVRARAASTDERRSVLAGHLRVLDEQPRRAVAWETLWDRWQRHPRHELVQPLFPVLDDDARRAVLRTEVAAFRVRTTRDDKASSVADCLLASGLSTANAALVLELLVELRHAWTSRSGNAVDAGYDDVNWRHACGELAQVLEIAADAGLGDDVSCDAALASLLSDCAKLRGNFLTHHVDGAVAAFSLLPRVMRIDTPRERQRVVGICQAIVEHQVGPPRFMANMVRMGIASQLRAVGAADDDSTVVLAGLYTKIADPMNPAHVDRSGDGVGCLRLSREERALLKLIELPEWYVPHPQTPWFQASSAVIDADSLVNYVTADGVGKIVAICGPGTPFHDPTVFHSIFSCGASFVDAVSVMSDVAMASVSRGLSSTKTLIEKVRFGVSRELAGGVLAFSLDGFDRLVAEEKVDLTGLKVRRLHGLAVVELGVGGDELPYWGQPLDYAAGGVAVETARLLRRKVADLLRAV